MVETTFMFWFTVAVGAFTCFVVGFLVGVVWAIKAELKEQEFKRKPGFPPDA